MIDIYAKSFGMLFKGDSVVNRGDRIFARMPEPIYVQRTLAGLVLANVLALMS